MNWHIVTNILSIVGGIICFSGGIISVFYGGCSFIFGSKYETTITEIVVAHLLGGALIFAGLWLSIFRLA